MLTNLGLASGSLKVKRTHEFPRFQPHSYQDLEACLKSDLMELPIPTEFALRCINELCADLRSIQIDDLQDPELATYKNLMSLHKALHSTCSAQQLNDSLSKVFIQAYFSPQVYRKKTQQLLEASFEAVLEERVRYSSPLPTLDGMIHLNMSSNHRGLYERAAVLAYTCCQMLLEFREGKIAFSLTEQKKANPVAFSRVFGATVSSKSYPSTIEVNKNASYIIVLVRGQAYTLDVFEAQGTLISIGCIIDQLKKIVSECNAGSESGSLHWPIGVLSAAGRESCFRKRKALIKQAKANELSFEVIDKALFVLALDIGKGADDLKDVKTDLNNRWYGATQLLVNAEGAASLIMSYAKGAGANVVEFSDELYKRSLNVKCADLQPEDRTLYKKIPFILEEIDTQDLQAEIESYINTHAHCFDFDIGYEEIKSWGLSPNSCFHLVVMLAAYEFFGREKPLAAYQAVEMPFYQNEAVQADWIYSENASLLEFFDKYSKGGQDPSEVGLLFKKAVELNKRKLEHGRVGLSPTYLLEKKKTPFCKAITKFFLKIGEVSPAYRGYIFRAWRNSDSIDIMSSSIRLTSSISFVSRPNTLLNVFKKFGFHLMLGQEKTVINFMPNVEHARDMVNIKHLIDKWLLNIKTLFTDPNHQKDGGKE